MEGKAWERDKPKDDGEDRGEIRTVFSTSTKNIADSGVKQCQEHKWRKLNETELACVNCPTAVICGIDDERLLL